MLSLSPTGAFAASANLETNQFRMCSSSGASSPSVAGGLRWDSSGPRNSAHRHESILSYTSLSFVLASRLAFVLLRAVFLVSTGRGAEGGQGIGSAWLHEAAAIT